MMWLLDAASARVARRQNRGPRYDSGGYGFFRTRVRRVKKKEEKDRGKKGAKETEKMIEGKGEEISRRATHQMRV